MKVVQVNGPLQCFHWQGQLDFLSWIETKETPSPAPSELSLLSNKVLILSLARWIYGLFFPPQFLDPWKNMCVLLEHARILNLSALRKLDSEVRQTRRLRASDLSLTSQKFYIAILNPDQINLGSSKSRLKNLGQRSPILSRAAASMTEWYNESH